MDSPTSPSPCAAAPDWSKQSEEIHCPLCDYNLRGLTEPRCPECGYAFEWADLTDPTRKRHPYLFEHHPNRNIWSFTRTVIGQLLPRRFWRSVRPEMPSNWRRLIFYWYITAGCCLLWMALPVIFEAIASPIHTYRLRDDLRVLFLRSSPSPNDPGWYEEIMKHGSLDAALDQLYPTPARWRFWEQLLSSALARTLALPNVWRSTAAVLFLVWPWATLLVLQLVRTSMREARILPIHPQRAILYSFDATVLLLVFGVGMHSIETVRLVRYGGWWDLHHERYEPIAAAILAGLILWRLMVSFTVYLRLKHAIETVVLTQLILFLVLLATVSRSGWLINLLTLQWLRLTRGWA